MGRKKKLGLTAVMLLAMLWLSAASAGAYLMNETIRANGKTFRLTVTASNASSYNCVFKSTLYQIVSDKKKKVASIGIRNMPLSYSVKYGNRLFFTAMDTGIVHTYSYTIGKTGFKKVKNNLQIAAAKGQYAIGYTSRATDIGGSYLCLYNINTGKVTRLGYGYSPKLIGGKFYYAKMSTTLRTMQIVRCNPNGTGKKVLKKLVSKDMMFGVDVKQHSITYFKMVGGRSRKYRIYY